MAPTKTTTNVKTNRSKVSTGKPLATEHWGKGKSTVKSENSADTENTEVPVKRKRGRPKGSKNSKSALETKAPVKQPAAIPAQNDPVKKGLIQPERAPKDENGKFVYNAKTHWHCPKPECEGLFKYTSHLGHCNTKNCHQTFIGQPSFDAHRVWSGDDKHPKRCMTVDELLAHPDFWQDHRGHWRDGEWKDTAETERKRSEHGKKLMAQIHGTDAQEAAKSE